jgi:hypothetical protein
VSGVFDYSSAAGLVALQNFLNLVVGHLVDKLCKVLHAHLGNWARRFTGLRLLLTVLNNYVTVDLIDLDRVCEVGLLVDDQLVLELVRIHGPL